MIRAVLDTNVIVSGILTPKSVPATILKIGLEGKFKLVMSPHVIEEIERVIRYERVIALMRRHKLTCREVDDFMQKLKRVAMVTPGELEVTAVPSDPGDDMVFWDVVAATDVAPAEGHPRPADESPSAARLRHSRRLSSGPGLRGQRRAAIPGAGEAPGALPPGAVHQSPDPSRGAVSSRT